MGKIVSSIVVTSSDDLFFIIRGRNFFKLQYC